MNKIKAILFDLDGVLVDACDWHYEALNKALKKAGYAPIKREDHLEKFNGLPTHVKLEMLGITGDKANTINRLKQDFTLETIRENAKEMKEKIELHSWLEEQGIKIGCVTNSIRETAEEMLARTGQLEFMDILVTNEDVEKNKPHPDCYNLAIKKLGVDPKTVLCVEDSEKGILAVMHSLAKHLLVVEKTQDVDINTFEDFLKGINYERSCDE
jgi:HAD superfamily hydrolase (TIGR01509 family)